MNAATLTNILLSGILLMQAYALIFRAPAERVKRPLNWREIEKRASAGNPPTFPSA